VVGHLQKFFGVVEATSFHGLWTSLLLDNIIICRSWRRKKEAESLSAESWGLSRRLYSSFVVCGVQGRLYPFVAIHGSLRRDLYLHFHPARGHFK
jgi:hypothetical protein